MMKGTVITPPTLLQQFRSFYFRNYPSSLEETIEYFSVFGGIGWDIDTDEPLTQLIEELILDNYPFFYNEIIDMTLGDKLHHTILSALALGDRRTHSAFKRAHISEHTGAPIITYLCQSGIISLEPSREEPPSKEYPSQKLKKEIEKHKISDKLNFVSPFMRFWFSFVAPLHRGIEKGEYGEIEQRFAEREHGFSSLIFEKLSIELLKQVSLDDPIIEVSSYWDRNIEIDIMAKTASGKTIVAECKYTNTKINKSELTKLMEKCTVANIEADHYVLFSKRGFSNELVALQESSLSLYTLSDFSLLLEKLSANDLIEGYSKPY